MILRLRYEKCNRSRHVKSNLKEDRVELCYGDFKRNLLGGDAGAFFSRASTLRLSQGWDLGQFSSSSSLVLQVPHRYHTDAISSFTSFISLGKFAKKKKKGKLRLSPMTLFIKRGNSRKFLVRGNYSPLSSREIKMSATPFAYVSIYPSSPSGKYRSNVWVWTPILKKYPVLFLK